MARSQKKSGGPKSGTFKPKKMGKGWLTARKKPIGSRPVLRITDPIEKADDSASGSSSDGSSTSKG